MNWSNFIRGEFTQLDKSVDDTVIDELAQHAAAAFEALRADGTSADGAEACVRALITSWCEGTSGPRRIVRPPLPDGFGVADAPLLPSAPGGRSPFAGLGLDCRHVLRLIRRQPGLAVAAMLMIALGIGATTTLFSLVNGVLLKPLPWQDSDRIVRVYEKRLSPIMLDARYAFTNATYNVWKDQPQTIEGLAAWSDETLLLPSENGLERIQAASVTATLFPLLRASPLVGRTFTADDERPDNTIILSYGYWRSHFGGDRNVVGRTIRIGNGSRTIVGVMPPSFEFPTPETRVWTPYLIAPAFETSGVAGGTGRMHQSISVYIMSALARLKPGVTPAQAADEASRRLDSMEPAFLRDVMADDLGPGPLKVVVTPMLDFMVTSIKPALWILLAAGVLLFAAAIGTVVNIQLAQATARRREMAIRSAIGAGTGRVARQLFVETTAISAVGGLLGLGLTVAILRVLPLLLPADFPRATHVAVDGRVLSLAAALTFVVSIAIGFMPTGIARRLRLTTVLAEDGLAPSGQSLRTVSARSRWLIITAQVAIAAVLLVGAALLSQSLVKMVNVDRGYVAVNLVTARIGFQNAGLPAGARAAFFVDLGERAAAMPGVQHAGFTNTLPLTPADPRAFADYDPRLDEGLSGQVNALQHTVSPGYIASMGITLIKGREFTAQDTYGSELVMMVNESFARRYLRGDPLDRRLSATLDEDRRDANPWRIVGVVADVRHRDPAEEPEPEVYAPAAQMSRGPLGPQFLTVRTPRDPKSVAADLRALVRHISPNGVVDQVLTMDARLTTSLARPRLYALLIGGFAAFAVLVALVGLFGGLSYAVTQRTREIGVRTALGATPRDIVALVLRQGGVMVLLGLGIGLGLAVWGGRFLEGFLFGVTTSDAMTFVVVGAGLAAVAIVACTIPAWRAAKIDALTALRR